MQVEFKDVRIVIIRDQPLKIIDGVHPFLCGMVVYQLVYACYQHIFVVRPVEDVYHPFGRGVFMYTP